MKILTFPDARQATPDMCGIASTQAILYYYGFNILQSKLAEMMNMDPESGVQPEQIVKLFKEKDLEADFKKMTLEDVKAYLDKDIPVILLINAWAADYPVDYTNIAEEGHYVVAVGYDDEAERLICDDPSFLDNWGYIGYDELMTRWRMYASDDVHILENYGIAVYGRPPMFNPRRIMHIDGSVKAFSWRSGAFVGDSRGRVGCRNTGSHRRLFTAFSVSKEASRRVVLKWFRRMKERENVD